MASSFPASYLGGERGDVAAAAGLADADAGDGVARNRRRQELPLQLVAAETEERLFMTNQQMSRPLIQCPDFHSSKFER